MEGGTEGRMEGGTEGGRGQTMAWKSKRAAASALTGLRASPPHAHTGREGGRDGLG